LIASNEPLSPAETDPMRTILLVDDEEGMLFSYGMLLRKSGYNVIEANSGTSGFKMAQQHLPDLILSDINMPAGDGSTLLRDLRHDPELRSKQIVLMTGKPELTTSRRVMEDGADDFLLKPVSMDTLLRCVEARLDRASINWRVEDQMLDHLRSAVPANLPHEFFTPMAGIIGLLEILRSGSSDLTPEELGELHGDAYQCALRLNRTLNNYLLILEIQTDSPDPLIGSLAACQVEEYLRSGIEEALRLNEDRRQDVKVDIKTRSASIGRSALTHIVDELVDNAFKFSRRGSPVSVEFGEDGRLTVTDKGRGMTPEEIGRIGAFRQFERKKYEQQGLGLGLLLVQNLCAKCGAAFSMLSQPGQGTQVQIAFP
jgi:two-component system, sensor histidine kinase and response regulator